MMMKNIGIISRLSRVVNSMLLIMLVLMVWWELVLVLVEIVIGIMFMMNVNDVIRIGWKCRCVVLMVVLCRFLFVVCCFIVNFMIRIVFFVVRLIMVIRLILKNRLLGRLCSIDRLRVFSMFSGIISSIVIGID